MPESETAPAEIADATPADLVEVGTYASHSDGFNHGLVVLAMRHPYWLVPTNDSVRLLVEPAIAPAARDQLQCFDRESVDWPPRPGEEPPSARTTEFITPLLWALAVMIVFRLEAEWPGLVAGGTLDSQAIFGRGEWWRIGSALFLHADAGHLTSNVLTGIMVFAAVTSTLGTIRGWLLLTLASLAGNLAVVWIRAAEAYRSLGASTAIFAGWGLLTGAAIRRAAGSGPRRWRSAFVPAAAGAIILAFYGAGGQAVDVGAHVAGFACGVLLGFAAGIGRVPRPHVV